METLIADLTVEDVIMITALALLAVYGFTQGIKAGKGS